MVSDLVKSFRSEEDIDYMKILRLQLESDLLERNRELGKEIAFKWKWSVGFDTIECDRSYPGFILHMQVDNVMRCFLFIKEMHL